MDRGQIAEVGPHDDLIARRGAYWRLHEAQLRQAAADDWSPVSDGVDAQVAAVAAGPSSHSELPA
jgi:ATP-binding cassette subfamily B protein